jgi:hypothetical protein
MIVIMIVNQPSVSVAGGVESKGQIPKILGSSGKG